MAQRSSSSSISVSGSPSVKPRSAQAQYGKRKLNAETKLDTRLLRRVKKLHWLCIAHLSASHLILEQVQRGEKPQNVTKLVKVQHLRCISMSFYICVSPSKLTNFARRELK